MSISISGLQFYPVKSLGVISVSNMSITEWGPHLDRRMMLVDAAGKFVTQRQCVKMAAIKLKDLGDTLLFQCGEEQFSMPWPDFASSQSRDATVVSELISVQIWRDVVTAQKISDEASAWLSDILGRQVFLVMIPDSSHRQVELEHAQEGDRVGFADGYPFLLISEASVQYLEKDLPFDLDINRFRPNIIVSGCEAFAEDQWKKIEINGIQFDIAKACTRCVMPTINPITLEKQPEVMKLMLATRKKANGVCMGQNIIHRGQGSIQLGNEIKILE